VNECKALPMAKLLNRKRDKRKSCHKNKCKASILIFLKVLVEFSKRERECVV